MNEMFKLTILLFIWLDWSYVDRNNIPIKMFFASDDAVKDIYFSICDFIWIFFVQLLKSEENASHKPARKACVQLVDNLMEHIVTFEDSLAGTENKQNIIFASWIRIVLKMYNVVRLFFRLRGQRGQLRSSGRLHHHSLPVQQNQSTVIGQTCHDYAALPDHKVQCKYTCS